MAASYLAAPRFTEDEEAVEKASMTEEEKLSVLSDLYGALPIPKHELEALAVAGPSPSSPGETEESVERALDDLEEELTEALESAGDDATGEGRYPLSLPTAAYRRAKERCHDIVDSADHRLLFLRAENFDPKLAAERLLKYWDNRISIFGESHAFGPLTLGSGAFDGDSAELSIGYPRLSPEKDRSGRALIAVDQSVVKRNTYNRAGMLRACWYVVHKAIEEEIVQKRGMILLGLGFGHLDQLDRKLDASIWRQVCDILPARIVACHLVLGAKSYDLIMPNIKFFLGKKARARLREYSGNDHQIRDDLARYGIQASCVPSEIGGGWVYDDKWFVSQRASESQ